MSWAAPQEQAGQTRGFGTDQETEILRKRVTRMCKAVSRPETVSSEGNLLPGLNPCAYALHNMCFLSDLLYTPTIEI